MSRMRMSMKSSNIAALALLALQIGSSCSANDTILRSGRESPEPSNIEVAKSSFESDLASMRTAGFIYIFALRRKNGGVIDATDKDVIRANTALANRRVAADEDRAFLIGSNFQIERTNMKALFVHFAVENFAADPMANTNANTNK